MHVLVYEYALKLRVKAPDIWTEN